MPPKPPFVTESDLLLCLMWRSRFVIKSNGKERSRFLTGYSKDILLNLMAGFIKLGLAS